ncbi:CBS domain-containing protein [Streptomyces sp. NBC_01007]|nr:CBS domain-containing protein [Streptomyces sp. NBC_01007]
MTRHGIERLPVVDEKDRLVDIVTRRDLLQVFLRSAEEMWQAVQREVFADALRLSPQISEVAVHDGAVTLTGQLESGAAPPSRGSDAPAGRCRRRRARPHLPLSTTGTHRPPDRPSTEWPTTGCVGHEPTDPTHCRPALRPRGVKGPRTWSRWPTDRGRSPAQPLVRLKGARTPARWAPLPPTDASDTDQRGAGYGSSTRTSPWRAA